MYRILISALAGVLLLPAFAHATDAGSLPSRKADVDLPLLKQFSSKDNYSKIEQILGKPDKDIGSGVYIFIYLLDDSTSISVSTPDRNTVFGISRFGPGINHFQTIYGKH
jgi:hypothetical protein